MKFRSIFMTFAAGLALVSCSDDEPGVNNPANDGFDGETAYLTINISDVGSRAYNDPNDPLDGNGSYEWGSEAEHKVETAHFYFFDQNGLFINQATVWEGDNKGDGENIEYMGKNTLVLKGLKDNTSHVYMLTVLNAPTSFQPTQGWTLDRTRHELLSIYTDPAAKKDDRRFIMTTTSFDGGFGKLPGDNGTEIFGVNVIKSTDFHEQAPGTSINANAKPIEVYVERLAAKIQVKFKNDAADEEYHKIPVTVAGNDNDEGGALQGLTEVYVKFTNWGINNYNQKSYVTKDISGFIGKEPWTATGNLIWNSTDYKRSFWGKSYGYDGNYNNGDGLTTITLADAKNAFGSCDYVAEYTDKVENIYYADKKSKLQQAKVTSVIFAAQVYEKLADGSFKELKMVRFNGTLYREESFLNHVLSLLNYSNRLNYYNKINATSTETTDAEGNKHITWTGEFKQLNADDFKLALRKRAGEGTGIVEVITNLTADNKEYYVKNNDGTFSQKNWDEAAVNDLTAKLLSFYGTTDADKKKSVGESYNGYTFYTIPVEHLIKRASTSAEITTGNYGIVRNHWYEITVGQIFNLGQGVFNPGTGTEKGEELIPGDDNQDPTFYLRAHVNVLSWKIVTQKVDL